MAGAVPSMPGTRVSPDAAREVHRAIQQLLRRNKASFPGAQPVSLARRHINNELMNEDYFVCEKSDGLRCLMYLGELDGAERVCLITRGNEVYWLETMHVPRNETDLSSYHRHGTLVDGELVLSHDNRMKYLMFDMLAHGGTLLVERNLDKRLGHLREGVYKPFHKLCETFQDAVSAFPFRIYMKEMQFSYGLTKVLREGRSHLSDGLIFTSRDAPYIYGTDEKILKWKPADENSVDFETEFEFQTYKDVYTGESWLDYDSMPIVHLLATHGNNDQRPYGQLHLEPQEWEDLKSRQEPLNHRIIECFMDDQRRWRYLRFRDDKENANYIDTINSVIESIQDRITEQDLIDQTEEIRRRWHERHDRKKSTDEPDAKRHHSAA